MISLVIDTCTSKVVIALLDGDCFMGQVIENNDTDLSTRFTSLVDNLFLRANLSPKDVDTIFVAVGPGSFTGTRIGVTFAKVMAWTLNKKVVPFSSLELIASSNDDAKIIVPLIDARRGFVYAGGYDNQLNNIILDRYIEINKLMEELVSYESILFVSSDEFNFEVKEPLMNIYKIVDKHKNDIGVNPHKLNPKYLKRTEAEEKLSEV